MPATIKATTQNHLSIEDITHNLILLKDGSAAFVLKVSAINFNLLSEQEQDSIIYSYAGLLNSLSFPIQVLIRSQKKDISNYIRLLQSQENIQLNPVIKQRITYYREFIEKIVKERNVLDKKFYVIIPFSSLELGVKSSSLSPLSKKPTKLPYDKNYIIQKALNSLEPKRDHLMRQFSHLNLSPKQLTTQELIQLFYNIYNPDAHEGVTLATPSQYEQSLVQSSAPLNAPAAPPLPAPPPNQPPPAIPSPEAPAASSAPANPVPPNTPPPSQAAPPASPASGSISFPSVPQPPQS